MKGKIIEIRDLGEFLVVKEFGRGGGFRLIKMDSMELLPRVFDDENELLTSLNIGVIREYRGEI